METPEVISEKKKRRKSKSTMWTWLLVLCIPLSVILFTTLIPIAIGLVAYDFEYSEGIRIGQVVKLSDKGLLWKTYEGSLGVTQSGAYVESWDFSIDEKSADNYLLISMLEEAARTGDIIEIKYSQRYGIRPWRGKTSYLVESVRFPSGEGQ
ncbi:MAG: hypothetical protein RLZZ360_296 [Candidatus Parcubacteria bacterium]|jgi:hypothetical protein